jgi:hypothetical protein
VLTMDWCPNYVHRPALRYIYFAWTKTGLWGQYLPFRQHNGLDKFVGMYRGPSGFVANAICVGLGDERSCRLVVVRH